MHILHGIAFYYWDDGFWKGETHRTYFLEMYPWSHEVDAGLYRYVKDFD